ncbi:hypothetical protein JKF63_07529 [Porcisia hertigi]|uniref:SMP-LTD domain-containing protein n=1 Tax=Porcisia hertigi TaxID=2761500 RepID=A0A836LFA5_9TRYP|nr:hypothetical protein JKF63_07529 [Porcisia hertigi]
MSGFSFLAFVYGALGAVMCCIFFSSYVFKKTEQFFASMVRRKTYKHAMFDAVAKRAAAVPPAKAETLCKMVCFNDGILGDAVECRMIFYGSTIDIYQVDKLHTLPDHHREVLSEHILGRINRTCVIATEARISKYHRHHNQNTRYAAIKGKCIVLSPKAGMPLFIEDPNILLKRRLRSAKETQRHDALGVHRRHLDGRGGVSSSALSEEELSVDMQHTPSEAHRDGSKHRTTKPRDPDDPYECMAGKATRASASDFRVRSSGGAARRSRMVPSAGGSGEGLPLSQWKCVALKFPTRRVQERWFNLLQSTSQSAQWRDFIAHLPQFDVFNLLVARLFFENSRANALHDLLEEKLKKKLERVSKSLPPKLRGSICLDALDVGGEIPLIQNVSDPAPSKCGDTEFDFDVLYRGGLALKIRFAVVYRDIRLPDIIFSFKVLELAGRMRFVVGPPPTRKFWLGGPQPPQLRLEFTQEVASHEGILNTVLKLLPDMSQLASNIVKVMLFEDMVFPNMDDFPWPVFDDNGDGADLPTTPSDVGRPQSLQDITEASLGTSSQQRNAGGDDWQRRSSNTPSWAASSMNESGRSGAMPAQVITVRSVISFDESSAADRNEHNSDQSSTILSPLPLPRPVAHSTPTGGVETPQCPSDSRSLSYSDPGSAEQSSESPRFLSSAKRRFSLLSSSLPSGPPLQLPQLTSTDCIHRGSPDLSTSRMSGSSRGPA